MSVLDLNNRFRTRFPEVARGTDEVHIKIWGGVDDDSVFCWFESLATLLNDRMNAGRGADLQEIFSFFDKELEGGDTDTKNCIDVSLVENLFWEVSPKCAAEAWEKLPKSLQHLYMGFHGRPPMQRGA